MANTLAKVFLTVLVFLTSGLTSVGTAGVSAIVGLGIIIAIWLPESEAAERVDV